MVFSSFEFMYIFLPITMAGWVALVKFKPDLLVSWLLLCSIVFYSYWSLQYTILLAALTIINFLLGSWISPGKRGWLVFAICLNLGVLGYFKYANFLYENVSAITGFNMDVINVTLPLGISFFVFQKIAFLVDRYRGQKDAVNVSLLHFIAFVSFFPQLIAGPIVHYSYLIRQFRHIKILSKQRLFPALYLFSIGLAKKVLIADQLALGVQAYDSAAYYELDGNVSMLTAWLGALFFTLQIYFDFSGYSDMALGLARLFGIRLPINFWSPYRATSIIEFWRRWHISLSTFLRDYIYIPLGGNRLSAIRRYGNLIITMLIGGLWHGASWTFVAWGMLHGCYLVVAHLWANIRPTKLTGNLVYLSISWSLTFVAVVVSWVFFKADSIQTALVTVKAMLGGGGIFIPHAIYDFVSDIFGAGFMPRSVKAGPILYGMGPQMTMLCLAFFIAILCPNSMQLLARARQFSVAKRLRPSDRCKYVPQLIAILVGLLLLVGTGAINNGSPFIYYNF